MRRILVLLAVLGLFSTAAVSAYADEKASNPAVYSTTAGDQSGVTPVRGYGGQVYPRWYGSYYYSDPGYYYYPYYPRYYHHGYYGYPGYYRHHYYPGHFYGHHYGAHRGHHGHHGGRHWR